MTSGGGAFGIRKHRAGQFHSIGACHAYLHRESQQRNRERDRDAQERDRRSRMGLIFSSCSEAVASRGRR